jgi:hypothetical protein
MQSVLDSSVVNPLAQPIGAMTGSGGSIEEPGDNPVAAGTQADPAGDEAIVVGPVALEFTRVGKRQHQVTARHQAGGAVVAVDTIDLAKSGQRTRFIEQVLEKLDLAGADATALGAEVEQRLLELASSPVAAPAPAQCASPAAEFCVVDDAGDPELNGIYTTMPPAQIANFDLRILEHIFVCDEDHQESRLRLAIRHRGQERSIEMTAGEFASNGRLRTVVYGSTLPGADVKLGADVLRHAVIALSKPAIRRLTTATGWTADRSRFLVPGGHVDADG